jgi:hypothetical protein
MYMSRQGLVRSGVRHLPQRTYQRGKVCCITGSNADVMWSTCSSQLAGSFCAAVLAALMTRPH